MPYKNCMETPGEISSSNAFYNAVAKEYNGHMTDSDRNAREIISAEFCKIVKSGNVLDFGGGTGLDLPWLVRHNNYNVFFLETSHKMQEVALSSLPLITAADKIVFAQNSLDFNNWSAGNLPFTEKMDGVLANFAVLNSIPNLDVFFEKMALICNKNCCLFFTVLDCRFAAGIKRYPFKIAVGYLLKKKLVVSNKFNGVAHTTYIHSLHALRSASANGFDFISYKPVPSSNFARFILSKK